FDEMHDSFARRLSPHHGNFIASFLFFSTPEINKDRQHPRFNDVRVDRESLRKSSFSALVVFRAAIAFEDFVDVGCAKTAVRESEIRVELDRVLEMLNRLFAVFRSNGSENETSKRVAPAEIFLVSGGALSRRLGNLHLLGRAELETQPLDYSLRDRVLHSNNVS